MAKLPVGYRSPFNKISSVKASPVKALDPVTTQMLISAAPGIISAVGSMFGRKRRRTEQRNARAKMAEAKKAFESIEYVNPYANLTNPYTNMENVFEDATVDTQAADYLREQQQQSQANIMQNFKGVAGSSGVAGLAQALSNTATQQARQASVQIAQQERANQQRAMSESSRLDQLERSGQSRVDMAKMEGERIRRSQENARTASIYGLGIDRLSAADKARQTARAGVFAGLGQAAGGIAGLYAPGGSLYDTLGSNNNVPTGQGFNFQTQPFGENAFGNPAGGAFGGTGGGLGAGGLEVELGGAFNNIIPTFQNPFKIG